MSPPRDAVDRITSEWKAVRPELDVSPIEIIGRVSRLSRLIDRRLGQNFARHGLEDWMYDVLATLRRAGDPYERSAGDLVRETMVTTGAITNRVDRLEERGLVERIPSRTDRRKIIVRLTRTGLRLVDEVVEPHLQTERELLAPLSDRQRDQLVKTLRLLAVANGDIDDVQRPQTSSPSR